MKTQTIFIFIAIALSIASVSCIRTKNKSTNTIEEVKDSVGLLKPYKPFSTFKGDTLKYLHYNFIDRKDRYIGKPLNNILNDSELEVKSWYGDYVPADRFITSGLDLKFDDVQTSTNKMHKNKIEGWPPGSFLEKIYTIGVVWQEPASMEMNNALIRQSGGNWNQTVRDHYGPMIIKSISVYKVGGSVYKSDQ